MFNVNQFVKPNSGRTAKKIIGVAIGVLMIILPIGFFIYMTLPKEPELSPLSTLSIANDLPDKPEITQPAWSGNGNYIIFDSHTHTEFSDGTISQSRLAAISADRCGALAFTDHSDIQGVSSPARFNEIDAIRTSYPNMIVFSALEINIPSYNGREHLTLITHPDQERRSLAALRALAEKENDDSETKDITRAFDEPFFQAVNNYNGVGASTLVFYNHPSRQDGNIIENKNDLIAWSRWSPHFVGFEGGPGHQNVEPHGLYEGDIKTVNRWDHIAGNVGDIWDQMLGSGYQMWGALASSDFHNLEEDFPPCTFSRTHVEIPERSHEGVLQALRAGTFWADMGMILNRFDLSAKVVGVDTVARPGSVVQLGEDKNIELNISLTRSGGSLGKSLTVEFISNCSDGNPAIVGSSVVSENESFVRLMLPALSEGTDRRSCYVRSVVRLEDETDPKVAMTNHIRFMF